MQDDPSLIQLPSETRISQGDSSPESSPFLTPSSTPPLSLRTLSLNSEKEEKLLKNDQITSSSITNSTRSTHNTIFSLFPGIKKPIKKPPESKKISIEEQLMIHVKALLTQAPNTTKIFREEAEKLILMDAKELAALLTKTRKTILSTKGLTERLKESLDQLKSNTSRSIDYIHGDSQSESDEFSTDDPQKSIIYGNVIGISLLEKLLFPQNPLTYCQTLITCKGFSSAEKEQLGDILVKIDPQFDLGNWLSSWRPSLQVEKIHFSKASESMSQSRYSIARNSIKLSAEPVPAKKNNCCCGC